MEFYNEKNCIGSIFFKNQLYNIYGILFWLKSSKNHICNLVIYKQLDNFAEMEGRSRNFEKLVRDSSI